MSAALTVQARIDRFVEGRLCPPIVARIPARVTPNAITLATSAVAWLVLGIAAAVPRLSPTGRLAAMSAVAAGILACMIGDCLDGQHARRTGQATRFGEWLDHALDCLIVPLMGSIVVVALDMPALPAAACVLCPVAGYHAQVVLYQRTGMLPPLGTSGMVGQMLAAGACLAAGVLLAVLPFHSAPLDAVRWGAGVIPAVLYPGTVFPFYRRAEFARGGHALFLLAILGVTALHLAGAVERWAWVFVTATLSLGLTGAWVTRAILRRPYDGLDLRSWAAVGAVAASAAGWVAGVSVTAIGIGLSAAGVALAVATILEGRRALHATAEP